MKAFEIKGWLDGKKIRRNGWPHQDDHIFFYAAMKSWGNRSKCSIALIMQDIWGESDWEEFQEPKPKRVLYEWMFRDGGYWSVSDNLMTEKEAEKYLTDGGFFEYRKTGREFEIDG